MHKRSGKKMVESSTRARWREWVPIRCLGKAFDLSFEIHADVLTQRPSGELPVCCGLTIRATASVSSKGGKTRTNSEWRRARATIHARRHFRRGISASFSPLSQVLQGHLVQSPWTGNKPSSWYIWYHGIYLVVSKRKNNVLFFS